MTKNSILILDFGSQYTQLITRVVREMSVHSLQLPWSTDPNSIRNINPSGIILSGGPSSIYSANAPKFPDYLLSLDVPILGICYGMQALAHARSGEVSSSDAK